MRRRFVVLVVVSATEVCVPEVPNVIGDLWTVSILIELSPAHGIEAVLHAVLATDYGVGALDGTRLIASAFED